jgi:hypothetical protein
MANLTYDEVMDAINDYCDSKAKDHAASICWNGRTYVLHEKLKEIIQQLVDNQET